MMKADDVYTSLVKEILDHGEYREDRTGTGTLSVFGRHLTFDLRHSFPLLTTKRVFFRGVAEELFFFLRGETDTKRLEEKNVAIWKGNTSREYLDDNGLESYPEGVAGPIYGWQWRNWNCQYTPGARGVGTGGIDQLGVIMEQLRDDPQSRRHVVSAWNPGQMYDMCLPPCHVLMQFYIDVNDALHCQMYQRSADVGLGLPFNIASYALLTVLMSETLGLRPGTLSICLGDAHIYYNHKNMLMEQIQREPKPSPVLKVTCRRERLEEYTFDDIELVHYEPHQPVRMSMSV